MIAQYGKRALSLFLAVVMLFSAVPVQVFATEPEDHDHAEESIVVNSEPTEVLNEPSEPTAALLAEEETQAQEESEPVAENISALAEDLANRINDMLEFYGITPEMTDADMGKAINAKGWSENKPNIAKMNEIEALAETATDADADYVLANADVETFVRFRNVWKPMFAVAMAAASGTHKPVTGVTVGVSGATDNSMSNGAVTVTAKGSGGVFGIGASAKTATITIYNESGSKAKISFDWTATSVNQLKIDGTVYSGSSGSFEKVLDAGESFTVTITTAKNSTTNKLVMKNFALEVAKESSKVTFQYDSSLGSITVAGTAVNAGSELDVAAAGVAVTATAKNGGTFIGWINAESHVIVSKTANFTLEPSKDMTIQAVFAKNAWFLVNDNSLYDGLNAALDAVTAVSNKTIVLANNGTLPAGDYTIPSGVTLLIPYDDANTLCTTAPGTTDQSTHMPPTAYRTMTMAAGANIIINGAMSLSAVQNAASGRSAPYGPTSFIQMQSGSNITVNNGGKLYAWGYIQGSGSVTVKSGGTAYECFQLMDWRGGDNTSSMIGNSKRVFPMSQYYVQNVEVPMTLEAGATENGYMSVAITMIGIQGCAVPFIGANGMFNITSGSIVKDYDENTGRLLIDMYGTLSVKSLSLSMKLGLIGTKTINSKDYVLPINGNMTVTMHSGSAVTMTQDIALQPGARMIIAEGATCTLGSGNKIYVYDYDQWIKDSGDTYDEGKSFCGNGDATYVNLPYPTSATKVQGRTEDAYVEVNGTVDASAGFVYTTASGANVRGTGTIIMKPGTETVTYQAKSLGSDSKSITYYDIPITSAKLQNADGTYVETADDLGKVIYKSVGGVWTCEHTYAAGIFQENITTAATCLAPGQKTITCNCGKDSKTEEIAKLNHAYEAVVTAPTCTAAGFTTHTCKNGCNGSYTDTPVDALGHTAGAEATCETAQTCTVCREELKAALGHTAGAEATCETAQNCTVCGKELVAALGHDEVNHEAKAPTCDAVGWKAYVSCSRCDYTTYVEIPALGHTWQWVTDKEATVLEPGYKHEECSDCHAKQNENTEIPVLVCGHEGTMTATEAKAATCTEEGNSAYWYCSACQNYYSDAAGQHEIAKDSWIISAKGHTPGAAATCETAQICTVCEVALVAALGHDKVTHEAKAPTCSNIGWEAYVTCSRCDYSTRGENLPVDPDAHVWDEGVPYQNHSCNSASYMRYTCTLCSEIKDVVVREQHFRIPIAEEIPATCTEDGMTSGWKCEKCDEFWIPQEVIPALGHDWNGNLPCQSETSACTRCDLHFDSKQDHLVVVDAGVAATCTTTGLTEGSHCGYCGEILVAQTEIPMAEHNWLVADMEIPATCNSVGHREGARYCLNCDYDADPIPALTHTWMHRDAKKATYSAIGWNAHDYCLLCNATKTLEQFENDPCEYCGENPEGYIEIPKVEVQSNKTVEEVITNIDYLEMMAEQYAKEHPGTDPLALVLNYMRTGVENYTSGSWAIMAGPEDKNFLKYVQEAEDAINSDPAIEVWVNVSGLKKLAVYPNIHNEINIYTNTLVRIMDGHFFGTMDMTYHNKGSQNHADVGGWVGDLTDLLSTTDEFGVPAELTLDEKVAYIREHYLFKTNVAGSAGSFGSHDLYADLDGYYVMNELITKGYKTGDLAKMFTEYYQEGLTLKDRFTYLMNNRLDGLSTRQDLRTAVYNAYTSNKLIATLEGTRNFNTSGNELAELRKAVCYAFADEMCRVAGDYVEDLTNPRFTIFDTETKILAPGISQQINYATNADGKQIVYYIATGDVTRDDVGLWVNYYDRDPGTPENPQWKNSSVPNSAQNAQDRYGDPASADYIENFNVIASTNAGGFDMSETATPGGLLVMNGVEWHPQSGTAGFFAILKDGSAYMGTHAEYKQMKDKIQEAIGGFGEFVVKDGKVVGSAAYSDAPRTSVGITATGRVVIMCIDGRQAPFSSGASLQDVGYIMKEAGCVVAINLDGGGSTTFVARQPGSDDLTLMNRPSDGYPRNVSTNLLLYSTAPSSTKFDHAVVESEYDYATINTPVQMTAAGVSPAGNAVDIPEGATWAVSNEGWASITEDGVFTGKRLGEVYVYLMLDGNVIGSKLMTMTNPDQLYFERAKVDAIYGSSVNLPLRARYEGKPIAINAQDVQFALSADKAGTMDGFTFKAVESTIKTVTITAAIDESIKASINVMLYKQGENSFDFDKATGGDRTLAWDRQVTNAKVEDGNIYNVIDPSKDMVASYTFALDMTTIPIPERIAELTYMLPGGTMEGATAWSFLLSLAQRISNLSWVKATIDFDDRFDVDYSELKIINEYFEQKGMEFDEATNTLTVTMHWIKQSQVINEATANPLCLINGIKLTPKDGVWEDVSKINVVTSGNIGYEIYMRASGLYSFAQKPESQAVFGIYPYRNPADTSDAGGYFRDTYAEITDEYTLVNILKEGWVNEDGGFAYYVSGERLTGVQKVDGFYYDFGENGINVGQTKLTGVFYDAADKVYRYSYIGELADGWQSVGDDWYYFKNYQAVSGTYKVSGVSYQFKENGKLISGKWVNVFTGWRYYYGPSYYQSGWANIDGEWYCFRTGLRVTGISDVPSMENGATRSWYDFGEDGANRGLYTGFVTKNNKLYFATKGRTVEKGLFKWEGEHYYAQYDGSLIVNERYYVWKLDSSSELPLGWYDFDAEGRLLGGNTEHLSGIVEKNGILYYYENGKPKEKGLFYLDGSYYCSRYDGRLIVDQVYYAWLVDSSSELPVGNYEFGPDGRMRQGIVDKNGTLYFYENGRRVDKGLFLHDGHYYDAEVGGKLIVNQRYYVWKIDESASLPKGNYEFGPDGRMLQGIVNKNGVLYYYVDGKPTEMGLFYLDGYHYYAQYNGQLITNQKYYAWKLHSSSQLPINHYEFAEDGRVLGSCDGGEITNKNGVLYYYENGKPTEKGLFKMDGYYYYSQWDGKLITGKQYYAWKLDETSELPVGHYEFDAEGRMYQGIVNKSGVLYYYENGRRVDKGLFLHDGHYYDAEVGGKLIVNQKYYVWKLDSCADLPAGHYEFDKDGRMLQGMVEKNGVKYYYENGKPTEKGLFLYEGDYYYSQYNGKLIVNQRYYAWKTDAACELPVAYYEFDADGKMIGAKSTGQIINKNGVYYYYENGQPVEKGLFFLDGHYYFAHIKGRLITNEYYYVWQGNDLLLEKYYTFNELGQIIK